MGQTQARRAGGADGRQLRASHCPGGRGVRCAHRADPAHQSGRWRGLPRLPADECGPVHAHGARHAHHLRAQGEQWLEGRQACCVQRCLPHPSLRRCSRHSSFGSPTPSSCLACARPTASCTAASRATAPSTNACTPRPRPCFLRARAHRQTRPGTVFHPRHRTRLRSSACAVPLPRCVGRGRRVQQPRSQLSAQVAVTAK